jgi:hypothetical protein
MFLSLVVSITTGFSGVTTTGGTTAGGATTTGGVTTGGVTIMGVEGVVGVLFVVGTSGADVWLSMMGVCVVFVIHVCVVQLWVLPMAIGVRLPVVVGHTTAFLIL